MPNDAITPFTLAVPQADLEDLSRRIDQTRWPDAETVDDWTQGAPPAKVKALVDHWRHRFDWRRCEAMLNDRGLYKTSVDGLGIHFLHVRSKHENALPPIITHGWPGSVIEFMKMIGPLTDPTAHGGKAEDAFHVIAHRSLVTASPTRRRNRVGEVGDSRRRQRLSARDSSPLPALGRSMDAEPDPLQHSGTGRPLRRLGAAGAARQRDSRLLRQGALSAAAHVAVTVRRKEESHD